VTEAEFNCLPPRLQEQVKRAATHNNSSGAAWNMYYHTPAPNRYKRVGALSAFLFVQYPHLCCVDWLRDKYYFEGLSKKDNYSLQRLGFRAPNVFVLSLAS
jgi:hypothetical protein